MISQGSQFLLHLWAPLLHSSLGQACPWQSQEAPSSSDIAPFLIQDLQSYELYHSSDEKAGTQLLIGMAWSHAPDWVEPHPIPWTQWEEGRGEGSPNADQGRWCTGQGWMWPGQDLQPQLVKEVLSWAWNQVLLISHFSPPLSRAGGPHYPTSQVGKLTCREENSHLRR